MADNESIYIGSVVRMECDVYDNEVDPRVLADPTTLAVTVTPLVGAPVTYTLAGGTVVKDSTGKYHSYYTAAEIGEHQRKWVSTGAHAGAVPGSFTVLGDS